MEKYTLQPFISQSGLHYSVLILFAKAKVLTKYNLKREKNLTTLCPGEEKQTNISNRYELATTEHDGFIQLK